jgi:hypothetical protein
MDKREDARAKIAGSRERVSEIASELARRASPSHLKDRMKDRMKEATVRRSVEIKQKTLDNPLAMGLIGAVVTAGVSRLLRGRRMHVDIEDEGFGEAGLPEEGRLAGAKEKLAETKERIGHAVGSVAETVKEKVPSGEEMKQKARQIKESASEKLGDQPLLFALGSVALGVALGLLVPVSRWERQTFRPVRERASDELDKIADTVRGKADELEEKVAGEEPREGRPQAGAAPQTGGIPPYVRGAAPEVSGPTGGLPRRPDDIGVPPKGRPKA